MNTHTAIAELAAREIAILSGFGRWEVMCDAIITAPIRGRFRLDRLIVADACAHHFEIADIRVDSRSKFYGFGYPPLPGEMFLASASEIGRSITNYAGSSLFDLRINRRVTPTFVDGVRQPTPPIPFVATIIVEILRDNGRTDRVMIPLRADVVPRDHGTHVVVRLDDQIIEFREHEGWLNAVGSMLIRLTPQT